MQDEANEFGRILSDDLIKRADELDRKLNAIGSRMGQNIKGLLVNALSFADSYLYKLQDSENWSQTNLQSAISDTLVQLSNAKEGLERLRSRSPGDRAGIAHNEEIVFRLEERLKRYGAMLDMPTWGLPAGGEGAAEGAPTGRTLSTDTTDPRRFLAARLAAGRDLEHVERLSSAFAGKLTKMLSDMPAELRDQVKINSGYRSPERQQQLWVEAVRKYGSEEEARRWVAPPGRSQHNRGNAADLAYGSDGARQWMHANARKYGLSFPLSNENWHIEDLDARRSQVDKDREEDMTRQIAQIEKETQLREQQKQSLSEITSEADRYIAAKHLEAQALGLTEQQAAALFHTQQMLNEAQRAGIEITPELESRFRQLGEGMAAADTSTDTLRQRMDELNDTAAFFGGEVTDALSGLITGTTTAEQALQQLYQTLVRATLQAALLGEGPLASLFGGGGGILSGLFGGGGGASWTDRRTDFSAWMRSF